MPRPLKDEPRSVARRAGEVGYADNCETHGPALFGVQSGKCLKCFTIAGATRKPVPTYDV